MQPAQVAAPFELEVAMDEAADLLEVLTDAGQPVFLWGTMGIGKTDVVHQLGRKKGRKVMEFHAALREPVDLRGCPNIDKDTGTTKWFVPDELPRADRDGEYGYLFCDEFNQATPQMQAVLAGLVLYGTVGDYHLPKGWVVIAAGNRVSDRAAAQRMPTHLRNRFAHIYCAPNVDAWVKWANGNGVPQEIVAFVRWRRDDVLHRMPRGDENAFPTPRSLTKCGPYVKIAHLGQRQKLFAANVGNDVAGELNGFIELFHSIGTLDGIIANPDTAAIPAERSQLYAVCTGLARKATRANFAKIMKYAERLTGDYPTLLVHDAIMRDPKLKETAPYSKWAVDHQAAII
jgi:hypothetical protein